LEAIGGSLAGLKSQSWCFGEESLCLCQNSNPRSFSS